jgi:hypothetical protein
VTPEEARRLWDGLTPRQQEAARYALITERPPIVVQAANLTITKASTPTDEESVLPPHEVTLPGSGLRKPPWISRLLAVARVP